MQTAKKILPYGILVIIAVSFFRNFFFRGNIPFPGDLLLAEYQPFRSYAFNGYAPGAIPNKAQYFDVVQEFYPWRKQVIEQVKQHEVPLWNPYVAAGSPLLANYQSAVFYPLNLLYFVINQPSAWAILIVLQPLLASLFTYGYARKIGITITGSLIASVAFAYCSYASVWLEFNTIGHTILWFPLILFCIEQLLAARRQLMWLVILIGAITSSLLAGHPIDFAVIYLCSLIYGILRLCNKRASPKTTILYSMSMIIPFALGLFQLIPTYELVRNSSRSFFAYDFFVNHMLIQPNQLIMLLIPDFFGNPATRNYVLSTSYVAITLSIGLLPFIFAFFTMWSIIKKNSNFFTRFFFGSALITLLLTVNHPLTAVLYRFQIPILSTNSPTKLLSVFAFSLSILAGFGVNWYQKEKNIKTLTYRLLPIGIIMLIALVLSRFSRNTMWSMVIFGTATFILIGATWLKRKTNRGVLLTSIMLITLVTYELAYTFTKFNPFVPKSFIFPETSVMTYLSKTAGINRIWGYGTAKIAPNLLSYYNLFSTDGFDALNLRWYSEFVPSSKMGRIRTFFTHENRSVAEIAPGYGETDLPDNHYRLRILDMLGVRFILDRVENPQNSDTFPTDRFKLVWTDTAGWKVFENLKAAARFFLTRDIQPYNSTKQFETSFFADNFNPSSTVLLITQDAEMIKKQIRPDPLADTETVKLITYKPNNILFTTTTKTPALLFISDTYDFGWKAYVDGAGTPIYRANYAFRAIVVPEGSHEVTFIYKPSIYQFVL